MPAESMGRQRVSFRAGHGFCYRCSPLMQDGRVISLFCSQTLVLHGISAAVHFDHCSIYFLLADIPEQFWEMMLE
jgi:hypothetical protein